MMHHITSIAIEGLWGKSSFKKGFSSDVNFLIGKNGTGKTTIINLITAALKLDLAVLESADFESINIKFGTTHSNAKPEYRVEKLNDGSELYPELKFFIKSKASEPFRIYSISEVDQRILFRRLRSGPRGKTDQRLMRLGIAEELSKLVNVAWLPVYRYGWLGAPEAGKQEHLTPIDGKVFELSNGMVRYFSSLESQVKEKEEQVQKTMFLSLLAEKEWGKNLPTSPSILAEEQDALAQIFHNFGLAEEDYQKRLAEHFELAKGALVEVHEVANRKARGEGSEKEKSRTVEGYFALVATARIAAVVNAWTEFQKESAQILQGRERFLSILNELTSSNKEFYVSQENELSVRLENGEVLPLVNLSSGEKQLVVILGEAMLQNQEEYIYIADEPELSLHVDWQESLVSNIRALNQRAQIIFATHSPDIVGTFDDRTIDVEKYML